MLIYMVMILLETFDDLSLPLFIEVFLKCVCLVKRQDLEIPLYSHTLCQFLHFLVFKRTRYRWR